MLPGENKLEEIRNRIDEIDDAIADLLLKRLEYAEEAKDAKQGLKIAIQDGQREKEVIEKWRKRANRSDDSVGSKHDLREEMMRKMAKLIIEYTLKNEIEEG